MERFYLSDHQGYGHWLFSWRDSRHRGSPPYLPFLWIGEKNFKDPSKFGKGFIAGVAAPEAANNAAAGGTLDTDAEPGGSYRSEYRHRFGGLNDLWHSARATADQRSPQVFWGLVASLYIGNIMLLVLNLPLIGLWVKVLKIPYHLLSVFILLFCLIGSYGINYSAADIIIMSTFRADWLYCKENGF